MKTNRASVAPVANADPVAPVTSRNSASKSNSQIVSHTKSNLNINNSNSNSSNLNNSMVLVSTSDRLKVLVPCGKKSPPQLIPCSVRLTDSYFTFKFHPHPTNNNHQVTRVTPDETADASDETALLVADIIGCQSRSLEYHVGNNLSSLSSSPSSTSTSTSTTSSTLSSPSSCPSSLFVQQQNTNTSNSVNTLAAFTIYAYPCKQSNLLTFSKCKKRIRVELTFIVDECANQLLNIEKANNWLRAIRWLKHDQSYILKGATAMVPLTNPKNRRLLVLINPASGPGKASSIFKEHVSPLLAEAGIDVVPIITKKSGEARTFISTAPLLQTCDGIVTISGDGLIFEVINGLMERPDRDTVMMKIPLGIIPGGSGNGLAHSINYAVGEFTLSNPILASTLNVISGKATPMDLVEVVTESSVYHSFLSVGYGLIADMDIESERLRCLGGLRFALWAIIRTIALRRYKCTLSYLPISSTERIRNPFTGTHNIPPIDLQDQSHLTLPKLNEPLPSSWKTIEGEFVMIYSGHVTHMASDCLLAPNSKLNDGVIWLVILPGSVTKVQVVQFLLALESGKHSDLPFVNLLPVRAFRLIPTTTDGYITVDGELIEFGPLQASILPGAARVMTK